MKLGMNTTMNPRVLLARYAFAALLFALGAAGVARGQAQGQAVIRDTDDGIKYARGQNVVPVFEGWVRNPDGTFSLVFGFWNRNWEESLSIPVGPDNHIDPDGPDRGQPTFFAPRRGKNLFEIVVPKDFGKKEVVWTLNVRGRTEKAYGALVPQEVLTRRMVLAGGSLSAAAAVGNDDVGDEGDPNKPPSVTIDPVKGVALPGPATIVASVTDDGFTAGRGRGARALRANWSTYRGPAAVAFDPAQSEAASLTGGRITTTARFRAPGNYTLRVAATDAGGLTTNKDMTVEVK